MKRKSDIIFILICLALATIPFLVMERQEDVTSEIDNRKLVELPVFGTDGYVAGFEAYLQDRIGFRNQMVNAYAVINDTAFHELTHPSYTYGQDGYVFFKMHLNNPYGDYPKRFADMVKKLQVYCESRGTKFYLIFDPEKLSVYREYLPKGVNYDNSWVDEMFSYMDELGINYVNNTQLLMDKSKKEQVFNKVYDAGHWNDLGMFYGTNALWKQIHEDLSVVIPMKKSEFEITEEEKNALPASNFRISEIVPTFKSKQRLSNETNDWRKEIELSPSYQVFYYKANESKSAEKMPKILMFQGSYYNRNTSFIESRANTYIGIHNYQNVLNLPYYYNIFKPDVVVLDAAEYVFTDSYFDSQVAELIDYNPSLLTDEITFDDKVESLKKDIKRHNAEITVSVAPGNKIDKLFLSYNAQKTKYAYLLINGEVYDFCQTDDNESLALSLKHGKVDNGDKGIILIDEKTNSKLWIPVTVQKGEPLLHQLSYSAGASKKYRKGKKVIELKTEMINNAFNSVALQLYDANTKKFMGNIATTNTEGKCASVYVHDLPSGKYKLTLKANSNLSDESVSCFVNLVKGNAYCYAFTVNKLSSKNCRITNYIIYGEQQ